MLPLLLKAEEMKAVPTRAVVFKAVREDCHSEGLPLVDALEDRTCWRQSRIPIRRFTIALDLAPKAPRSTPPCSLAQILFGFDLQAPGDSAKQMRSIERERCFSEQIAISCSELSCFQLPETLDLPPNCIVH